MAYISNLDSLQPEPLAIDSVPESVAREYLALAVSRDNSGIRIVIPADSDASELQEMLAFFFSMPVILDTADRDSLQVAIDYYYTAISADVENCPPRFNSECPKRWLELEQTENEMVRHCSACDSLVFHCRTRAEVKIHAAMGRCVAYGEAGTDETLGFAEFPC